MDKNDLFIKFLNFWECYFKCCDWKVLIINLNKLSLISEYNSECVVKIWDLLKFRDESLVWIYESNILWNSDYNLSVCIEDVFEYKLVFFFFF